MQFGRLLLVSIFPISLFPYSACKLFHLVILTIKMHVDREVLSGYKSLRNGVRLLADIVK